MKRLLYLRIHTILSISIAIFMISFPGCSRMMDKYGALKVPALLDLPVPIITPYLWIANSRSNTVAQVDVNTGEVLRVVEIDPAVGANPSRTAVDYNFNCWVGLRGNSVDGILDRVVKIDAETGEVTVGPQVGEMIRGVAINRHGQIWASSSQPYSGSYGWLGIDPETMLPFISFSDTAGSYGLAINPHDKLFSTTAGQPVIKRLSAITGEMEQAWQFFDINSLGAYFFYGIAADQQGNVWNTMYPSPYVMGQEGDYECAGGADTCTRDLVDGVVTLIDVTNVVAAAGETRTITGRGICVDINGNIWAAFHVYPFGDPNDTPSYVVKIDKNTMQAVQAIPAGNQTVGVTADHNGNIWAVNREGGGPNFIDHPCPDGISGTDGTVTRINTVDSSTQTFPTCGDGPYTYSDMAGFALRGIVMRNPASPGSGSSDYPSGVFVINDNDVYAFHDAATLNMNVMNANEMCFSNDSVTWTSWEPYSATRSWTLTAGNGQKTVYGLFRSSAGNVIQLADGIILRDETAKNASNGPSDEEDDLFGSSVAVSGNGTRIVIGAPGDEIDEMDPHENQGSVYIFSWNGSDWIEDVKIAASDGEAGDQFGGSVSISSDGNTIVVGAPGDDRVDPDEDQGSAYIFTWDGSDWNEVEKIEASDGEAGDLFGSSVSISPDGSIIIAGAPFDDVGANVDQGSAWAYYWDGSLTEITQITAEYGEAGDQFGSSTGVSSLGQVVVIGAPYDNSNGADAGSVSVYSYSGGSYTENELLAAGGAPYNNDNFGFSVAITPNGENILVGAPSDSIYRGSAFLYTLDGGAWDEKWITASDRGTGDRFGYAVACTSDGQKMLIGAPYNNGRGSVYLVTQGAYNDTEQRFFSTLYESGARFGYSLSCSSDGEVFVIGAPYSDVGANDDQGKIFIY